MSEDTQNWILGALAVVFVCAALSLLIAGWVNSEGGREPSAGDHTSAIPAGVTEINNTNYLISNPQVQPTDICWGFNSTYYNGPVASTRWFPKLKSTFVQCAQGQTWNDHRPPSYGWGQGIANVATSLAWEIGVGVLLALSLLPALLDGISDYRRSRKRRKERQATVEDQRKELRLSYAKGEITEQQFEDGLNRLFKLGLKAEKET